MLGLGDIVIPGIFVALCCRYDDRGGCKTANIFTWAMVGYVAGLGTTVFVMHVFKAAQPALLYIVPALIVFTVAGAHVGGCLTGEGGLWNYSEEAEEKDNKTDKTE